MFPLKQTFKRKYYEIILCPWQYDFIVANGGCIGVTIGGHIGNFSGVIKRKGKLCHLINVYSQHISLVNFK